MLVGFWVVDGVANADIIGEFAFGTSEKARSARRRRRAVSATSISRSATTTVPIGGQNVFSLHLDGVVRNATLRSSTMRGISSGMAVGLCERDPDRPSCAGGADRVGERQTKDARDAGIRCRQRHRP